LDEVPDEITAPPPPAKPDAAQLLERISAAPLEDEEPVEQPQLFAPDQAEIDAAVTAILIDMVAEPDVTFQPPAKLFQDFSVRCRMQRLTAGHVDMAQFRRRFAMVVAGVTDAAMAPWPDVLRIAASLPDDLLAPFLAIARAA